MYSLAAGPAGVTADPADGCRLVSLTLDGAELLGGDAGTAPELDHGCFPMAPYAGRVRDGRFSFRGAEHELPCNDPPHAIHGLVHDRPWETVDDGVWRVDLDGRWPFGGHVVHRVLLDEHRLRLELEVHAGEVAMPATCGWHPWWRRDLGVGGGGAVVLDAATLLRRGDDGLPTGERVPASEAEGPLDDCFTDLGRPSVVSWPGFLRLTVTTSAAYAVVFTEPAEAVCLEPQTGPPDALNIGGATVVEPGSPLRAWMEVAWDR